MIRNIDSVIVNGYKLKNIDSLNKFQIKYYNLKAKFFKRPTTYRESQVLEMNYTLPVNSEISVLYTATLHNDITTQKSIIW